jgi:hypothetical protein
MELPRPFLIATTALFGLSFAGLAVLVAPIVFWDIEEFWRRFEVAGVSRALAALLGILAASSGLLFLHHRGQQSYTSFAEIVFLASFGISLCNLLWVIPVAVFKA